MSKRQFSSPLVMFQIRLVWWHYSSKGWYLMWTVHRQKPKKVKDGLLFVLRHPAVIKDGGKSDKLKPGQKSALGRPHSSERWASTWQKEKTSFTLIFNSSFFCTNVLQKWFVFSNKIENKKNRYKETCIDVFVPKKEDLRIFSSLSNFYKEL